MDVEDACSSADCLGLASGVVGDGARLEEESVCEKRKTLHAVLEQCQRALELLNKGERNKVLSSWDVVSEDDLWEGDDVGFNKEDYVVVRQEDIVEGIACFMKDLTPNLLQEALSRTFSVKRKKGKLQKAWDGLGPSGRGSSAWWLLMKTYRILRHEISACEFYSMLRIIPTPASNPVCFSPGFTRTPESSKLHPKPSGDHHTSFYAAGGSA